MMLARRTAYAAAGLALGLTLALGARAESSPSSPVVTAAPAASERSALSNGEVAFMQQAAQSGHLEVEGSQLALSKSGSPEVKAFAQQMVTDHTAAGEELKALAGAKGVKLPAEPSLVQKGKLKLLGTRDGSKFDKQYVDGIGVSAHEDTVRLFRQAAERSADRDVKAFATKTLPKLEQHLAMARSLKVQTDARP